MLAAESLRAIIRERQGKPVELRRPGSHTWLHRLPFKLRFKRSRIFVSVIPVWVIGFIMGFIGAVMGIGGGFLLVPMLVYLLRVPTATVIGTSTVLTLVTMISATLLHAATNHQVDAVLALMLMVGGSIGAQFGAQAGQKMRAERLRLLLGVLILAVGIRFALVMVVPPSRRLHACGRRSIASALTIVTADSGPASSPPRSRPAASHRGRRAASPGAPAGGSSCRA